jgi:hypothetical protein
MNNAQREQVELSLNRLRRYKVRAIRDYVNAPEGSYIEGHALGRIQDFKAKQVELTLILYR